MRVRSWRSWRTLSVASVVVAGMVANASCGSAGGAGSDSTAMSATSALAAPDTVGDTRSVTTLPVETVPPGPPAEYGGCIPADIPAEEVAAPTGAWRFAKVSRDWHIAFSAREGRRGPVAVVGDSLTKSSLHETMAALAREDFGPICIDAGFGRYLGTHRGPADVSTGVEVIARIKASEPVWGSSGVTWVIAMGTNDVGWTTPARASAFAATQIAAARAAIGHTSKVTYWVNVATARPPAATVERLWNEQLLLAGVVIDWADAVAGRTDVYLKGDHIHLTGDGVALRSDLVVRALVAAPQQETP